MGKSTYQKKDGLEFFNSESFIRDKINENIDKYGFKTILDPCCGQCGLEDFSKDYKYILYDIADRGVGATIVDFLKKPYEGERYDCSILNPPFGLLKEFVEKTRQYTDVIYLISPIATALNNYGIYIDWTFLDKKIPLSYKVNTSIGVFRINFTKRFSFGKKVDRDSFLGKKIDAKDSWKNFFYEATEPPKDKYFIVNRLTKARVLRGEQLIKDYDLYEPGDESAFIAICGNINVKKGDKIKRNILAFDNLEEMKRFQKLYDDNSEYVRDYCYFFGDQVLRPVSIPYLMK